MAIRHCDDHYLGTFDYDDTQWKIVDSVDGNFLMNGKFLVYIGDEDYAPNIKIPEGLRVIHHMFQDHFNRDISQRLYGMFDLPNSLYNITRPFDFDMPWHTKVSLEHKWVDHSGNCTTEARVVTQDIEWFERFLLNFSAEEVRGSFRHSVFRLESETDAPIPGKDAKWVLRFLNIHATEVTKAGVQSYQLELSGHYNTSEMCKLFEVLNNCDFKDLTDNNLASALAAIYDNLWYPHSLMNNDKQSITVKGITFDLLKCYPENIMQVHSEFSRDFVFSFSKEQYSDKLLDSLEEAIRKINKAEFTFDEFEEVKEDRPSL